MKNGEDDCYGVNWAPLEVQIRQKYIGKTKQNRWKTKRRARKQAIGATTGHHDRGDHHGQAVAATTARPWCPLAVVVAWSSECRVLVFLVHRLGPRGLPFLGVFWASSCYHLLILMGHTSLA